MKSPLFIVLAILLATPVAMAKEYEQDPFNDNDFVEKPVLLNKEHQTAKRLELGINFNTSLVDKYIHLNGGSATIGWHFHDTFAMEIYGGFNSGSYTVIYEKIQKGNYEDLDLPAKKQMTWVADLVFKWTPIYGKINIVSELAIRANMYFLFGAGVNGTKLQHNDPSVPADNGVAFNFQWGVGGQIFITKWMALRLEYRDIDFPEKWQSAKDESTPAYTVVTMNHMFHVGLSFFPF